MNLPLAPLNHLALKCCSPSDESHSRPVYEYRVALALDESVVPAALVNVGCRRLVSNAFDYGAGGVAEERREYCWLRCANKSSPPEPVALRAISSSM